MKKTTKPKRQEKSAAPDGVQSWSRADMMNRQQAAQSQLLQMQSESETPDSDDTIHDLEKQLDRLSKSLQPTDPPAAPTAPAPEHMAELTRTHSHHDIFTHGLRLDEESPGLYRPNGTFAPYRTPYQAQTAADSARIINAGTKGLEQQV